MRYSRFLVPHVIDPEDDPVFPEGLVPDDTGLVAIGGDLSDRVILEAYRKGIFPWSAGPPVMWYSPDPRMVLLPRDFHVSRRLARTLRQNRFTVAFDRDFELVILKCASVRRNHEEGTWIGPEIQNSYTRLHHRGMAHNVSVYRDGELCGGLYGLSLGRLFFGESMFSESPDASKIAFYHLSRWMAEKAFLLIDCQVYSKHLARLGAVPLPRRLFLALLEEGLEHPDLTGQWRLE